MIIIMIISHHNNNKIMFFLYILRFVLLFVSVFVFIITITTITIIIIIIMITQHLFQKLSVVLWRANAHMWLCRSPILPLRWMGLFNYLLCLFNLLMFCFLFIVLLCFSFRLSLLSSLHIYSSYCCSFPYH